MMENSKRKKEKMNREEGQFLEFASGIVYMTHVFYK